MSDRLYRGLFRPWRSAPFRVQALALLLAGFAITALLGLRSTVEQRFNENTAVAVGADLILQGSSYPSQAQRQAVSGFRHTEAVSFTSVLIEQDTFLLASIRAVADGYPLYGQIRRSTQRFAEADNVSFGPQPGNVWVAGTALDRLALNSGDTLNIGQQAFSISHLIIQEPDQSAGFYSMNPRVLMHLDDLAATEVLNAGSRYQHQLLIAGEPAQIATLVQQLQPTLRADQTLNLAKDSELRQQGPIAQLFLWTQLAVMLVVLLCAAAIYLAAGQRAAQQRSLCAVLKTVGAGRRQIIQRTLGGDLLALLLPTLAGMLLALLLVWQSRVLMQAQGAIAGWVLFAGVVAPLLLWCGFAAPTLWRQLTLTVQALLREREDGSQRGRVVVIAMALLTPVPIAWLLAGSLLALGPLLGLMALIAIGVPLLLWPLIVLFDRASGRFPLSLRLALRRLSRRKSITLPLMAALILALGVLSLSLQAGRELLAEWRATLPDQAPNYFVVNLFDEDVSPFRQWLSEQGADTDHPLYPVIRGRLVEINQQPVRDVVSKEEDRGDRALNRDLSLTESDTLPASNRTLTGRWLSAPGEVSVESELAESLGLEVGDQLTFTASEGTVEVTVVGLREVDWESFAPNFYFIFSEGSLAGQARTWLTSFYLADPANADLGELIRQMPHITLLDVNALLDQIQQLIQQASQAATLVGLLLLLAALLVLAAALLASAEQQRQDNRLLQILGARMALLRRVSALRALLLIGGAALLANLLHLAALWPLGQRILDGAMPLSGWLLLPWGAALLLTLAAWLRPGVGLGRRQQP